MSSVICFHWRVQLQYFHMTENCTALNNESTCSCRFIYCNTAMKSKLQTFKINYLYISSAHRWITKLFDIIMYNIISVLRLWKIRSQDEVQQNVFNSIWICRLDSISGLISVKSPFQPFLLFSQSEI